MTTPFGPKGAFKLIGQTDGLDNLDGSIKLDGYHPQIGSTRTDMPRKYAIGNTWHTAAATYKLQQAGV